MNLTIRRLAIAFTICSLIATASADDAKKSVGYITKNGKLTATLVYKDSQSGFAGVTGTILTIQPDGSWQRQTFLNKMIRKADKSGKLSPEQVKELARVFKENHLAELPAKLDGKLRANPKKISVAFGKKEVQFVMQGGGRLPKVDPKQAKRSANDRFILIATAIKRMLKPKKAD